MLEVIEPPEGKKSPVVNDDGRKRIKTDGYYCLRVFILSYDPLTVEIHCRGPWPHFIFNVGECSRCFDLYKELYANDWKNSPTACGEDWDAFVCRVKRAPSNSHQFLSYYGGAAVDEPDNPNDINNIFILRGQWQFDDLRECSRGCFIPTEKSHVLHFDFETRLRHSPPSSE
uniref:Uncharacterized protein n=1 Tax=Panagrolaimus davidi TaxID=227884 RepID=A0A914PQX8_9BILA